MLFSSHRLNASRRGATAVPPASVFGSRNTRHETRITAFSRDTKHESRPFRCLSGDSSESHPNPGQPVFHETRDTNHGFCVSFKPRPQRKLPWSNGRTACLGFGGSRNTKHETRITKHGFFKPRPQRKPPWSNGRTACLGFWGSRNTNHETRITAFSSSTKQGVSGRIPQSGSKPAPRPPRCSGASSCCGSREASPRKAASHASRRSP